MNLLENASVRRVRDALIAAGAADRVMVLDHTAHTARDAARSVGSDLGAIVKSLLFTVGSRPVMALISGDRRCRTAKLAQALSLEGEVRRADADLVRHATGFAIGGVAPLGLPQSLPMAMDKALDRFDTVYAAAGHPHCVFAISPSELQRLTGAIVSAVLSELLS